MTEIKIDTMLTAWLAGKAGLRLDVEHGLMTGRQPVDAYALPWFMLGAYGITMNEREARAVLIAARGMAAGIELEQILVEMEQGFAQPCGMIDPARLAEVRVQGLVQRLKRRAESC